ncbi:DUF2510 domain-containing protein [Enemella sp. A6]|uniref:DUF2510 domain-containing protein n=1 Tax=Enemella sp. A6 TaxID=3440152 RepID=UPI003EBDE67F
MAEKAGWYPDPGERPDVYRWWTGRGWTNWLADSDDGPPPEGHDNPRVTAVVVPRGDRQVSLAARTMVIGVVVLLVLLGLAAAGGAATNRNTTHPDFAPTPSGLTEPPATADAKFSGSTETLQARFGDVAVTLPPGNANDRGVNRGLEPVLLTQRPVRQPSGADNAYSLVMFGGYAGPPRVDGIDYADYLLAYLAKNLFGEEAARITDVEDADVSDLPEGRAVGRTAVLRYEPAAPGDSGFDRVEVIVIELNSAQRAVWVSMIPDNAEQSLIDEVAASRASLKVN